MRGPARSMCEIVGDTGSGVIAYFTSLLAFAGYGSRERVVDTEWHVSKIMICLM